MYRFSLAALALAMLVPPWTALAQDKGKTAAPKELFKEEGSLTEKDPKDGVFTGSFQKTHTVKLDGNQVVRIDLKSTEFDSFLRLLDETGKILAQDDDSGGLPNARIVYALEKPGVYKLVVTSFDANKTGKYTLTIVEGDRRDKLVARAQKLPMLDKKEKSALIDDVKKYLADRGKDIPKEEVALAAQFAHALEHLAPDLAANAYEDFAKLLAKSSDEGVAKYAKVMEGSARRLNLPGKEMMVKGTTMDGKEFDWKPYRGKVVLVDFWATWCGPCVQEMPNIRKMYDTYKDQGFDVVGISFDRTREDLEKFIEAKKVPWTCLFEKDVKDNVMVEHYGISSIPLAVLVDRDGKVLSINARGPELARLLEKHMSAAKAPAK